MKITYDTAKNKRNIEERNLSFDEAINLDWNNAIVSIDDRYEYGETRYIAMAPLNKRVHVICFTQIFDGIRVISFRKANKREVKSYENR